VTVSSFDAWLCYVCGSTPYPHHTRARTHTHTTLHYTTLGGEGLFHCCRSRYTTKTLLDTSTVNSSYSWVSYATVQSMAQHTDHIHISCSSVDCFLALFLHLANTTSLFSFGQSVQRTLLQVGPFNSPNCWAHPMAHHGFQYSLHGSEQQDP
jgi:hypothetical protein